MDLHILLVSHSFPPYTWGGVGTQTFDLVNSLARLGVHVTVCCGGPSRPDESEQVRNLEVIRLPTIEIPPRFLWFQLKNGNALKEKLAGSDLLHSQWTSFSLYPLLTKGKKLPWIVSFHGSPSKELKILLTTSPTKWNFEDLTTHVLAFPLWASLNLIELRYADNYIICGNAAAQDVIDFFHCEKSKVHVIQNGIDFFKIKRIINNAVPIDRDRPTLFYCGRLYWRKGIEYLIRAMPYIIREHKKVVLKIFGKGPLKSRISRLISALHLENNVKLIGYANYDRLIKEMNAADIAVFPSLYEGLSVAMLEAMACSKPVVTFDYPFASEIIKNMDNGVLVPPKNTLELSKAVSYLLSSEHLRKKIGNAASEYVKKNHDWSTISQEYLKIYNDTMNEFGTKKN